MKKRVWILSAAILLLASMLAVGVFAEEEETTMVPFPCYTDADGVRQYCACGNKYVADENGTIAYVNGENGCLRQTVNGTVIGCDGTILTWKPMASGNVALGNWGTPGTTGVGGSGNNFYLTGDVKNTTTNIGNATNGSYHFDLNGYTIYRENARALIPKQGGKLFFTDTSANKTGKIESRYTASTSNQGAVVWFQNINASVTLFGGTIDGSSITTTGANGGATVYLATTGAELNILGGEIKGGTASDGPGGAITVNSAVSTVNLLGGTVSGGSATNGGTIYNTGIMNIAGSAKIIGGSASGLGGGIYNAGTVTMTGGTIERGAAGSSAALIYQKGENADFTAAGGTIDGTMNAGSGAQHGAVMLSGSTFTVDGGIVKGNPKSIYAYGATVNIKSGTVDGSQLYINNGGTVNVTGGNVKKEIYLNSGSANLSGTPVLTYAINFSNEEQRIVVGTLNEGADVLVNAIGYSDTIIPNYTLTDPNALQYMTGNDAARELYWIEGEGLYSGKYGCKVCGGVYDGCDHAEKVKYTPWAGAKLPNVSGNYYLTQSFTVSNQGSVDADAAVVLDLNGKTLKRNLRVYALVNENSSLTITDTSAEKTGTISVSSTANSNTNGMIVLLNTDTVTLNLYAGTLDASGMTNAQYGAAIANAGTINIYGGIIKGGRVVPSDNDAHGRGGAIYVGGTGTLNMDGGIIYGGNASKSGNYNGYGGAIAARSGSNTVITGGQIYAGSASYGAAIHVAPDAELTLNDSIITGAAGTTIWNQGSITLSGTVSLPSDNFDLMIDGRISEAYLDIEGLAATGETPITVRRWTIDTTDDDPGVIAVNATAAQAELFAAWKSAYYITGIENELHLKAYAIQARNNAEALTGYASWQEAMADTTEGITYYMLTDHVSGGTITKDILIDLNGFDLTDVTIPEGVTLYGMDSTTDDYDCTDGYGTISGTVNGTVATNIKTTAAQIGTVKRYLTVTEDSVTSFHRFYMGVTHMNLRPGVTGVGYKALFCGDSVVQQQVVSYGFNLWVADGNKHTAAKTELDSGKTVSLRLENFDVANYGEANVNATVFMQFANGVSVESTAYSYTLRSLVEQINGLVDSFTDAQVSALKAMCENNADAMSGWDIANILNWTASEAA